MSRRSTVAVSTRVPALNVLSTTLPESTFFNLVRTNAPPLPGLTCWKSTTDHSWPSRLSTMPFLRSFVVATWACLLRARCRPSRAGARVGVGWHGLLGVCEVGAGGSGWSGAEDEQLPRRGGEQLRPAVSHNQGVLDPDPPATGKINPGLDGDRHAALNS